MFNKRVNKMLKIGSCLGLIAAIFSAAALPGMNVAVHAEENEVEPVKQENLDETTIEATKDILNSDSVSTEDINEFEQSLTEKIQNKEIQKEPVQFSGSSEPVVEDNKVTVTVVTEFYNRDGSLNKESGGISTYTRTPGTSFNVSTAIYKRGWILESETVTGMVDTNPNNYKAEGIIGNDDIMIKYVWREDNIGPDGQADKIPDQYQIKVSYDVINGTWNDGTTNTVNKVYTLTDSEGNPSDQGTARAQLPSVGNKPNEGFVRGSWQSGMKYTLTKEDDGFNFVYTYAPSKNVTVITEFYNRDGSLSTVKGGTSTYTRAIGSTIDFGTATYNRGWILESETVTGMMDTNPNNYRAQGTVGNEDITIKYVWREDNIGPDGQADKIPDQYQIKVTYDVVNGTWNDGTNDTIYKVYTLFDENGDPSQDGTVKHELPEVGNAPLEGYTIGKWSSNIEYELTHKDDEAHFTYTYSVISDTDVKPSKPSDTENPKNESTVKETKTENKVVNTAYSTNVLSVLGLFMLSLAGILFGVVKKYLK